VPASISTPIPRPFVPQKRSEFHDNTMPIPSSAPGGHRNQKRKSLSPASPSALIDLPCSSTRSRTPLRTASVAPVSISSSGRRSKTPSMNTNTNTYVDDELEMDTPVDMDRSSSTLLFTAPMRAGSVQMEIDSPVELHIPVEEQSIVRVSGSIVSSSATPQTRIRCVQEEDRFVPPPHPVTPSIPQRMSGNTINRGQTSPIPINKETSLSSDTHLIPNDGSKDTPMHVDGGGSPLTMLHTIPGRISVENAGVLTHVLTDDNFMKRCMVNGGQQTTNVQRRDWMQALTEQNKRQSPNSVYTPVGASSSQQDRQQAQAQVSFPYMYSFSLTGSQDEQANQNRFPSLSDRFVPAQLQQENQSQASLFFFIMFAALIFVG
jgi:hypothetical protein